MGRSFSTLRVEPGTDRTVVTLNRPERRNAIGSAMVNELLYAFEDAFEESSCRVVVLTGAGKAFCAGGDFAQLAGAADMSLPPKGDYADLLHCMVRAPKPILARVNGHAMGGGLGLVAASTFAVAVDDAMLGTPEVHVGLFPMMIMAVLARNVPRRRLLEMMLLGQRIPASEARDIGMLNRVVPPSEIDAVVDEICRDVASKSPSTIRLGLEAFADQSDLALEQSLPLLRERLAACLATEDAVEGLTAFMQKRAPQWKGR